MKSIFNEVDIGNTNKIPFQQGYDGQWYALCGGELSATWTQPRPIGPLLCIVSSEGPVLLIMPTDWPKAEVAAWKRVAQRFTNDLLLYEAMNLQIITDADFVSKGVGSRHCFPVGSTLCFGLIVPVSYMYTQNTGIYVSRT